MSKNEDWLFNVAAIGFAGLVIVLELPLRQPPMTEQDLAYSGWWGRGDCEALSWQIALGRAAVTAARRDALDHRTFSDVHVVDEGPRRRLKVSTDWPNLTLWFTVLEADQLRFDAGEARATRRSNRTFIDDRGMATYGLEVGRILKRGAVFTRCA